MRANDKALRELVAQQASDWFIANRAELAGQERENFAVWLRASPLHVEEYLALAAMSRDLREVCGDWAGSIDSLVSAARDADDSQFPSQIPALWPRIPEPAPQRFAFPWRSAVAALAAFGIVSLGLLAWWKAQPSRDGLAPELATTLHFATQHGEQQTHRLEDGSVLHLNTDSVATVRFSNSERIVILAYGEAEFEAAHELQRPFRVFAGAAEAVDMGTQFAVRLERESTVITVLEGKVAVGLAPMPHETSGSSHPAQFVELSANQQIRVAQGAWPVAPIAVDSQRTASWLRRQISFDHEPLARVANEFNRYTSKPIEIDTPGLGELEISGVFATDDLDAFVAFLRSLAGVHVEVTATRIRVTRD
jgi:transmembrane sensor